MFRILSASRSLLLAALLASQAAHASTDNMPIDAAGRRAVLERLLATMDEHYVFTDQLPRIKAAMQQHAASGAYDSHTSATAYAAALTAHLRDLTKDLHMSVSYRPQGTGEHVEGGMPTEADLARIASTLRRRNFDFRKAEVLDGNVGYLKIDSFANPQIAGQAATAAMNMVANSDALILDLRDCRGGGQLYTVVAAYLFGDKPVPLGERRVRSEPEPIQMWTEPYTAGPRYGDKPVYLLTSKRTFSACEALVASLRDHKRATLVGETTRGGGNTVNFLRLNPHFVASVPVGSSRTILSGYSWEGVGVPPDVAVSETEALATARRLALTGLRAKADDERHKALLDKALSALQ